MPSTKLKSVCLHANATSALRYWASARIPPAKECQNDVALTGNASSLIEASVTPPMT
jgi:hypothetical protein